MKIDRNSPLIINKPVNVDGALAQQWSHHLDDEYYWQHQDQLQQSELKFNPVAHDNQPTINKPESEIDEKASVSSFSVTQETLPQVVLSVSQFPLQQPTHQNLSEPRPLGSESVSLMQPLSCDRGSDKSRNIITQAIKTGVQKSLHSATFKPYQLFVDEKKVELTFNTTHLSKQQLFELRSFIQQWLNQNGYSLKQLVLNGEPQ